MNISPRCTQLWNRTVVSLPRRKFVPELCIYTCLRVFLEKPWALSSLVLMSEKAKHSNFDTTKQWNSNERLIFKFRIKVLLFISGDIRRRDISTPLFLSAFRTLSPCPWQPGMAGVQSGSCSASPTMRTRRTMRDLMILRCKRSFASQKC